MDTTYSSFDWIPFYKELAQKLLEYKNRRNELIDFIFANDGLREFSDYLHLQDKNQKITDIDPFSFMGMFNRGSLSINKRKEIIQRIKNHFKLNADLPTYFDGIPVLNYMRMFFYNWHELNKSCSELWEAYESMMNGDLKPWFDYNKIVRKKAECTIPLFWCKPDVYISLDSRNVEYLKRNRIYENVVDTESYQQLLQTIKEKMESNQLKEKSFVEISYNAFKMTQNSTENNTRMEQIDAYTNLLRSSYNLILTGAPGTGKTYLAKQIAEAMGCTENEIGFVQFHPSYDYTDFVEGLRPNQDDNGSVGFERKDGVFKEFCKKAIVAQQTNSVDNFNEVWDKLVNSLNENDFIDVPFISNKSKTFRVELNEYGTGLANRTYQNDDYQKGEWIKGQSKFFSKEQLYNIYRGLPGIPSGGHDNYRKAVVNYMKENLGLKDYQIGTMVEHKKPFVFIIDEINRGEINKIFGELFFSIDPGYRGEKGCVQTQYQNIVEDGDIFKKGFFVPENVYIIGTMNDIDRSVESMDFAFRRRFAFKEVTAKETQTMLDSDDAWESKKPNDELIQSIKNRMDNLNNTIWHKPTDGEQDEDKSIEGLSSAFHIGASYFLKLKNYEGDFDKLWEYHLEGLLREYLRGMQNVDEIIEKLKTAYNNESDNNDGQQQQDN